MSATVRFDASSAGIAALFSPAGEVGRYMERLGEETAAAARVLAPVESGALRASIRSDMDPDLTVEVSANTDYAIYVHEGTAPHTITPRSARVLRFPTKGGKIVYTTKVNHPGTQPQPFLMDALRATVRP